MAFIAAQQLLSKSSLIFRRSRIRGYMTLGRLCGYFNFTHSNSIIGPHMCGCGGDLHG